MAIPSKRFEIIDGDLNVPAANFYAIESNDVLNFRFNLNLDIKNIINNVLDSLNIKFDASVFKEVVNTVDSVEKIFDSFENRLTKDFFTSNVVPEVSQQVIRELSKEGFSDVVTSFTKLNQLNQNSSLRLLPINNKITIRNEEIFNFNDSVKLILKDATLDVPPALTEINKFVPINGRQSQYEAQKALTTLYTINAYRNKEHIGTRTYPFSTLTKDVPDEDMYKFIKSMNDIFMWCCENRDTLALLDCCLSTKGRPLLPNLYQYNPNTLPLALKSFSLNGLITSDTSHERVVDSASQSLYLLEQFTIVCEELNPMWSFDYNTYELSDDLQYVLKLRHEIDVAEGRIPDAEYAALASQFK